MHVQDYQTPGGKVLSRDLTSQLNTAIQFLVHCRPLSVPQGNAIKFLKLQVGCLLNPLSARLMRSAWAEGTLTTKPGPRAHQQQGSRRQEPCPSTMPPGSQAANGLLLACILTASWTDPEMLAEPCCWPRGCAACCSTPRDVPAHESSSAYSKPYLKHYARGNHIISRSIM